MTRRIGALTVRDVSDLLMETRTAHQNWYRTRKMSFHLRIRNLYSIYSHRLRRNQWSKSNVNARHHDHFQCFFTKSRMNGHESWNDDVPKHMTGHSLPGTKRSQHQEYGPMILNMPRI